MVSTDDNLSAAVKIGEDLCSQLIATSQELSDLKVAASDALLLLTVGKTSEAKRKLEEALRR